MITTVGRSGWAYTWIGRRDHAMLLLAIQTGLRISELIGLTVADVHLGQGAHVYCVGKGRKERRTPLLDGEPGLFGAEVVTR